MSAPQECPFCGGAPMLRPDHNHSTGFEIECVDAGCAVNPSVWKSTEAAAIAAWNRRATPAEVEALRARVERLEALLGRIAAHAQEIDHDYYGLQSCEGFDVAQTIDEIRAALEDRT